MSTDPSPAAPAGDREIYGMPSFVMLEVRDLEAASRWYQDVLGFIDIFTMRRRSGEPVLAHLRWRKYADLLLRPRASDPAGPVGIGMILNFAADSADAIAERVRAAGAADAIIAGPVDRPWNARDVTVRDPDGFQLNFTAPLPRPTRDGGGSFEQLVERLRDRV